MLCNAGCLCASIDCRCVKSIHELKLVLVLNAIDISNRLHYLRLLSKQQWIYCSVSAGAVAFAKTVSDSFERRYEL